MNNNEETLIEDSLAQSLLCNLFTIPWDHLYKLFHITPLFFFYNVTFVKNTQFYKLHRFPSQSFYFYKTVAYVQELQSGHWSSSTWKMQGPKSEITLNWGHQIWSWGKETKHWTRIELLEFFLGREFPFYLGKSLYWHWWL